METDALLLLILIVPGLLIFGLAAVAMVFVIRDTIRQRGKWGINLKPAVCTQCGTPMPTVRKPANWRQALWGGGTCPECGFELDKWGRPVEDQNSLAKWNVLRAANETERGEHRPRRRDGRIREANDQTQRGEAP
jgi:hypothetical protein